MMKPSGIGGMAVMEGVMMKNKEEYAVAVRKPDNEIVVEKGTHKDFSDKVKLFKLPIFRGMLAFVDSLVIGMKVLNFSASFFDDEENTQTKKKKDKMVKSTPLQDDDFEIEEISVTKSDNELEEIAAAKADKLENNTEDKKSNTALMLFAVLLSIVLSVTLFMVLPVLITGLFSKLIENKVMVSLIEGVIRLAIFIGYVLLASRMPEIKRVFMYHGAEHKAINCLENGFELTVENVRWQSKQHKRCGTSFMLLVILISLVIFLIVPVNGLVMKIISRVLLVPFIAGVSYEFIRLAGKSESKLVNVLSKPGLWMQGLTTKEPDDAMIEVAIKSVESVFDWRSFLGIAVTEEDKDEEQAKVAPAKKQTTGKKQGSQKKRAEGKVKKSDSKQVGNRTLEADSKTSAINMPLKEEGSNTSSFLENSKSSNSFDSDVDEEDDEILKALDKFFDYKSED